MLSMSFVLGVNCVKNLSLTRVVWRGVAAVPSLCISLMQFR